MAGALDVRRFRVLRNEARSGLMGDLAVRQILRGRQLYMEVGVSVHRGPANAASWEATALKLVADSLDQVQTQTTPVRLLMLLATADWCKEGISLPKDIRTNVEERLGYDVPLIGGSMAKLYCSTESKSMLDHGLILIAYCSDEMCASVAAFAEPHSFSEQERASRIEELVDELDGAPRMRLGISAESYLLGIAPGHLLDDEGHVRYADNELYQEVLEGFDYQYQLVGGGAASDLAWGVGYQFANDQLLQSGLALAMIETGLGRGLAIGHGFHPQGANGVTVDQLANDEELGYEVVTLDGMPAADRLRELNQINEREIILGKLAGADYRLVMPLPAESTKPGRVVFNRKVAKGERLELMEASVGEMRRATSTSIARACADAEADVEDLKLILVFSCAGRFREYDAQHSSWLEAAAEIENDFPQIPMVGMLCSGEFGSDPRRQQRSNNMSVSVCSVTSERAPHLDIRELQSRLLRAAEHLGRQNLPEDVMSQALRGGIDSGATGGMICLVDRKIGRILGQPGGYAYSPRDSEQDWPAIAKRTHRPVPQDYGGGFPAALREWSMPVDQGVPLDSVPSLPEEEDILTFIVRVRHAVFVVDARDRKFLCHQQDAAVGNIVTFLAIPLVGANGEAIATLQLSFRDGMPIDRESFGFWIGYAQKVGAALRRTQETWEKRVIEDITRFGNKLLQESITIESPHAWCDQYLKTVVDQLGADDAHMRLLEKSGSEDAFRLVGAFGPTANVRRKTRRLTRDEHGSCNRAFLAGGGTFTHTQEETRALNKNVQAIDNQEELSESLDHELRRIQSTGMLPVCDRDENIIGSLVIDSTQPYFFTESRRRIAIAAANHAGTIHSGKSTQYDHERLDRERNWMLKTLSFATRGSEEERLRALLDRTCTSLKADVASLYVWYEEAKKFVLRMGFNWYQPDMEGKASYIRGEGWTGKLPFKQLDVEVVHPGSPEAKDCTGKYYDAMIPREHRLAAPEPARIGAILRVGKSCVGVVTFTYYGRNTEPAEEEKGHTALLAGVTRLITLGVEAARQDDARRQSEAILEAKSHVAQDLIAAANPGAAWQPVMDRIREGFQVERVTFYDVQGETVALGAYSVGEQSAALVNAVEPFRPAGALRDVIDNKRDRQARNAHDILCLENWPNLSGVRTLTAVPVLNSENEVLGVLEFANRIPTLEHPFEFLDCSERQAAIDVAQSLAIAINHRQLVRAGSELRSQLATAVKIGASSLLGGLAMHRLLTPFTRIQGAVDWLTLRQDLPIKDGMTQVNRIQTAYNEALEMVQQSAYRGTVGSERTSLRAIVRSAHRVVAPEVPPRVDVVVRNEIDAPLHVDAFAVVGALVNFLSNALDAMKERGRLTIETSLSDDGKTAIARIHNTGAALTATEIKQAFTPGFTTKPGGGHLGIGLPLAKRAIEGAAGDVQMSSPDEGGVEVKVMLPVAKKASQ